jgi:hypothetical protein
MSEQPPDLLTIEEAARVLRIGRTKAYAMSQEWRVTNGEAGIKVCELGGQLRVPKAWLEEQLGAPVLFVPSPRDRSKRSGHSPKPATAALAAEPKPSPAMPTKHSRPRRGPNRTTTNSNQLTLPFS